VCLQRAPVCRMATNEQELQKLLTDTIGIPAEASREYAASLCSDGFDSPLAFEEVTAVSGCYIATIVISFVYRPGTASATGAAAAPLHCLDRLSSFLSPPHSCCSLHAGNGGGTGLVRLQEGAQPPR
jgi:hypothetical protein